MSKHKILFFILRVDNKEQITGGALSTLQILTHLKKFEPYVVLNQYDILAEKLNDLGIQYEVLISKYPLEGFQKKRSFEKLAILLALCAYNLKMWQIIKRVKPTIIQCDEMGAIMVFLASTIARKNLVIYVRNSFQSAYLKWNYKLPMLVADSIVTISSGLAYFLSYHSKKLLEHKIVSIHNAVDLSTINELKSRQSKLQSKTNLNLRIDALAIGIVAFIEPRKRQKEFLQKVLPKIKNNTEIEFYFLGGVKDRIYEQECMKIIHELNLQNIFFVGYQKNMNEWYRALDIVCLPSEREGLPRALIESAAFELPVVSFNIPGSNEAIIQEKSGFLVESFDEFSCRLNELINCPELRVSMGKIGYEHVLKKFDVNTNTNELEVLYENLI